MPSSLLFSLILQWALTCAFAEEAAVAPPADPGREPAAVAPAVEGAAPAVTAPGAATADPAAAAAGEVAPVAAGTPEDAASQEAQAKKIADLKQMIREKLWKKLSVRYGRKGKLAFLTPVNSSKFQSSNAAIIAALHAGISKFGEFELSTGDFKLDGLSLEAFRKILIRTGADVLVITSIKPDQMNMFIYDRLTPYYVYAHTETFSDPAQLNEAAIISYAKLLLRRTLFDYVEDQYFELPRGEVVPLLKREVPNWVASAESIAFVNREFQSRYYASVSLGAAMIKGPYDKSFWNSNILSIAAGYRPVAGLFLEGAFEAFTYNAFLGSVKYMIATKNSPLRFVAGVGVGHTTSKMALNLDETFAFPSESNFVVPSIAVMFPIVDVHFKIESRLYLGLTRGGAILTVMPGMVANF